MRINLYDDLSKEQTLISGAYNIMTGVCTKFLLRLTSIFFGSLNVPELFYGSGSVHYFVWYKYACKIFSFRNHPPLFPYVQSGSACYLVWLMNDFQRRKFAEIQQRLPSWPTTPSRSHTEENTTSTY